MTSASLDLRQAVIDLDAFDQLLMCCDFAIANILRSRFLFIEFEHAKTNSIFSVKASTKAHQSYQ